MGPLIAKAKGSPIPVRLGELACGKHPGLWKQRLSSLLVQQKRLRKHARAVDVELMKIKERIEKCNERIQASEKGALTC